MKWLAGIPVFFALSLGVAQAAPNAFDRLPLSTGSLATETTFQEEAGAFPGYRILAEIGLIPGEGSIKIPDFAERFAAGQYEFGLQLGYGFTINIPPVIEPGDNRTDIQFAYFSPYFKYNLTGVMGDSYYRGAWYWVVDFSIAISTLDPERNKAKVDGFPTYVIGFTPFQLEYKFVRPERRWAPFVFAGGGMSVGNWHKGASEVTTAFQFILQAGAGIEYYLPNGKAVNFSYRFWHLSNGNLKPLNIGLNAHIFTLGFTF